MSNVKPFDEPSLLAFRNDFYKLAQDKYAHLTIPEVVSMLTAMALELCDFFPDRRLAVMAVRDAYEEELGSSDNLAAERLSSVLKSFN